MSPLIRDSGFSSGTEKSKDGSLDWGVEALVSTLSTGFMYLFIDCYRCGSLRQHVPGLTRRSATASRSTTQDSQSHRTVAVFIELLQPDMHSVPLRCVSR